MTRPHTNRGALPYQSIQEARHLSSVARSGCAASSPTSRKCNESFLRKSTAAELSKYHAGRRNDQGRRDRRRSAMRPPRLRQWFRFRPGFRSRSRRFPRYRHGHRSSSTPAAARRAWRRKVRWRERGLLWIKTIGHVIGRIEPRIDGLNAKQDLAEFHQADV
jgi:hypothetical protein